MLCYTTPQLTESLQWLQKCTRSTTRFSNWRWTVAFCSLQAVMPSVQKTHPIWTRTPWSVSSYPSVAASTTTSYQQGALLWMTVEEHGTLCVLLSSEQFYDFAYRGKKIKSQPLNGLQKSLNLTRRQQKMLPYSLGEGLDIILEITDCTCRFSTMRLYQGNVLTE